MNYPLISEYIEAVMMPEDNFDKLNYLRPVLDGSGQPIMTSGNFAVVFKMEDANSGKLYAIKCFLKDQEGRAEAYRQITEELEYVSSSFLTSIKYLDKELFVDSSNSTETEFPILLMDWVEGRTLDRYIRDNIDDEYELSLIAYQFSRLSMWLLPQPFAHGDLKPDNIIVKNDGSLTLVDYDGMYVPAMKGQKARELGSPNFRHPLRTADHFNEHIDDFSVATILLSLKAIALQPSFWREYGSADRLLFSEDDYRDISKCELLKELYPSYDCELNMLISFFNIALINEDLSNTSSRLLYLAKPKIQERIGEKLNRISNSDIWTDDNGVRYSKDRKILLGTIDWLFDEVYVIPEGTVFICGGAFVRKSDEWHEPDYLKKIVIPSSVKFIGGGAFPGQYKVECKSPSYAWYKQGLYTSDYSKLIYYRSPIPSEVYLHPNLKSICCDYCFDFTDMDIYDSRIVWFPTHVVHVPHIQLPYSKLLLPNNAIISVPKGEKKAFERFYDSNSIVEEDVYIDSDGVFYSEDRRCLIAYPTELKLEKYEVSETCVEIRRNAFGRQEVAIHYVPDENDGWCYSDYMYNSLTVLRLHDNIRYIDEGALSYCRELRTIEIPYGSKSLFELLLNDAVFFKKVDIVEYYEEKCWIGPEMSYSAFVAFHGECSLESRKERVKDAMKYVIAAADGTIALLTAELNEEIIKSADQANLAGIDPNKIKIREYHIEYTDENVFVAYTTLNS
jgi:serine/threonine protein kinase